MFTIGQQVDAASWADDKKGAHKALAASLEPRRRTRRMWTLVQAAHEASSKVAKQPGSVPLDMDAARRRT